MACGSECPCTRSPRTWPTVVWRRDATTRATSSPARRSGSLPTASSRTAASTFRRRSPWVRAVRALWSGSCGDRRRGLRTGACPALILGLGLLGVPAGASVAGSAVVVHVSNASGEPLAKASVIARCPGDGAWQATTDAKGLAVIGDVPRCALSVEPAAGKPGDPVSVSIERLESSVVSVEGGTFVRDLPSSRNAWSFLETVEPAAILDRLDGAGLHLDEPGRFSLRGSSWTQNTLLLDGVDVTDPVSGGAPLVDPDVDGFERAEAVSGLSPVEAAGAGVVLLLVPSTPARSWQGTVRADAVAAALQQGQVPAAAPAIARFGSLVDVRASASGPIHDRVRALLSSRFSRVRRIERDDALAVEASHFSGAGQLLYEPSGRDAFRFLATAQTEKRPFAGAGVQSAAPRERADAFGAVLGWKRVTDRTALSSVAGVWRSLLEPTAGPPSDGRPAERLLDGPVPARVAAARSQRSNWTLETSLARAASRFGGLWHALRVGARLQAVSATDRADGARSIPETVDGLPSRVWEYV